MQCSRTAAELLAELEKLQLDPGGGLRQVISKSVRAMRKRNFVKDVQTKLDRYQLVLDTRILVGLNAHSIKQTKDFQSLDQDVRDLVIAVSQGRNTVAQLFVDHGQALRDHIDRRFDHYTQTKHDLKAQQQFKQSLFFPEMFSRQEEVSKAHKGTCRWIFQSLNREGFDKSDTKLHHKKDDNDYEVDDRHGGSVAEDSSATLRQTWSNFVDWLEHGKDVYWLNGQPGSGKSTLMKYISSAFQTDIRTQKALTNWTRGSDLVVASYFFWNAGTALQKSLRGLLRSLLFQIADQRQDLMSIMMPRQSSTVEIPFGSLNSVQIHTWTEERLFSTLQRFLTYKPTSISLIFFIDGLDEFVEDEDTLIATIRLLNKTPQAKVCVSSRPERNFRQGFSASPQLRLKDFNHQDIEKAATEKLLPVLRQHFPQEKRHVDELMWDIVHKAQGIFLWLELMTKDLKKGTHNGDTLPELHARLETTPDTIEGLYEHMLSRLNKPYLQEAAKYFRLLLVNLDWLDGKPLTLLDFVSAERIPWGHVLGNDLRYFKSSEFHDTCKTYETRILARCAGFVEIEENPRDTLGGVRMIVSYERKQIGTSQDEWNLSCHLRRVKFIHRTAADFLRSHHRTLFRDTNWRSAASLAVARGKLGFMSIVPFVTPERGTSRGCIVLSGVISIIMKALGHLDGIEATGETDSASQNVIVEMVNHTYRKISHVDACLNGSELPWYKHYNADELSIYEVERLPFHDAPGFAAFYGCSKYILPHMSLYNRACEDSHLDYLLGCTLIGYRRRKRSVISSYLVIVEKLLRQGANPNLSFEFGFVLCSGCFYRPSAWGIFFQTAVSIMLGSKNSQESSPTLLLLERLVDLFVLHDANVNVSIMSEPDEKVGEHFTNITVEESPLSYLERMCHVEYDNTETLKNSEVALKNLLRSRGALQRRCIRIVCIEESDKEKELFPEEPSWYQLSQKQSDRLCEVWPSDSSCSQEELVLKDSAFHRVFQDLKTSLTEAALVDPSNLLLRTSFSQTDTDVVKETNQLKI